MSKEELKFASTDRAIQYLANLTGKRIKVATSTTPSISFMDGSDSPDLYSSLKSIVKDGGKWKSEKQANFILNAIKKYSKSNLRYINKLSSYNPDTQAEYIAITAMNYNPKGKFGKHERKLMYAYWVDKIGIIQEAKLKVDHKYQYMDPNDPNLYGAKDIFEKVESVTWKRDIFEKQEENLTEENKEKNKEWFESNSKDVELVLKHLSTITEYRKLINKLKTYTIPDKDEWNKAVKIVEYKEENKDEKEFPKNWTKMDNLEIIVESSKPSEYTFKGRNVLQFKIIGRVPGYSEKALIKLGEKTFKKWTKKNNIETPSDNKDTLKGSRLILKGDFKSDGNEITSNRATVVKIEDGGEVGKTIVEEEKKEKKSKKTKKILDDAIKNIQTIKNMKKPLPKNIINTLIKSVEDKFKNDINEFPELKQKLYSYKEI